MLRAIDWLRGTAEGRGLGVFVWTAILLGACVPMSALRNRGQTDDEQAWTVSSENDAWAEETRPAMQVTEIVANDAPNSDGALKPPRKVAQAGKCPTRLR